MPPKKRKNTSKQTKSTTTPKKLAKQSSRGKSTRPKTSMRRKQSKKKTSSAGTSARTSPASRAQRLESSRSGTGEVPARRSEDFQGLSRVEQADSESVDELVEEGNVAEAGAVAGVEEAEDEDTEEVHTHEVPEDDVQDEYLDKD